ncbi:MAG: hypothetical protein RL630_1070 [Verrucomicrobiota bacterium]|jgi:hypothetical protein
MYFPVLLWCLVIFASFWGYGEALRRSLKRPEFDDLGWGLTAAWGMAVTLSIGGFLMMLSLAKTPILAGVVLFGAALAAYQALGTKLLADPTAKKGKKSKPADSEKEQIAPQKFRFEATDWILCGLMALVFISAIAWPYQIDPNDDVVCYLAYPKRILDTGTLIEPFNVRRMGTFGGQAILQAIVMVVGDVRNAHVPDRALGMLLLFGMLLQVAKGAGWQNSLLRFLAIGSLFFVSVPRINTGSSLTGAAVILALLLTLVRFGGGAKAHWALWIPSAILVAAAGSFRLTYLLATALIVVLAGVAQVLATRQAAPGALSKNLAPVLGIGGLSFALLIPYMAVFWQSHGVPIYPPFLGTMNPEFTLLGSKEGPLRDMAHAFGYLFTPEALVLALSMILAFKSKTRPLAVGASLAVLLVSWFTSYKFGVTMISESYRYTFPMMMPVAFWLLTQSFSNDKEGGSSTKNYALVAVAILWAVNLPNAGRELGAIFDSLPAQITSSTAVAPPVLEKAAEHLQKFTPEGSKILVAIDTPYALDFSRNTIYTADVTGASSIGKWPLRQGPEALKKYLLGLGIDYILASDFDNAMLLYTRKHWIEHQRPEWFFKEIWGKYMLDFMDSVDSLAKSNPVLGTSANLRLIDLKSSANQP